MYIYEGNGAAASVLSEIRRCNTILLAKFLAEESAPSLGLYGKLELAPASLFDWALDSERERRAEPPGRKEMMRAVAKGATTLIRLCAPIFCDPYVLPSL